MNKIYCQSCYKSTSYESAKPNFCSFCGSSFISESNQPNASVAPKTSPIPQKSQAQIKPKTKIMLPNHRIIEPEPEEIEQEVTLDGLKVISPEQIGLENPGLPADPKARPNRINGKSLFTDAMNVGPLPPVREKIKGKRVSKKEAARLWQEQFPKSHGPTEGKTITISNKNG